MSGMNWKQGLIRSLTLSILVLLSTAAYAQEAKKLTKAEALNAIQNKVPPDYPPIARQLKIEGTVELEALVSETGSVEKVNIVSDNPVLTKPATEAVKRGSSLRFKWMGSLPRRSPPITITFKL